MGSSLSGDLGRLVVAITGDRKGLTSAIDQSKLDVRSFSTEVQKVSGVMQTALGTALGFGAATIGLNAIGAATDFAKSAFIDFNSRLEQAQIGFTTMLGSAQAAQAFIADMKTFAARTPFEFAGLQDASQRMLAMGFEAKEVLPTLTALGDAVAGLGGSTETLNRVTYALGQMKTAGRVTAQDMMQLTSAGIPAWQMLADAMGLSIAQVRKLSEQGLIPADKAIAAITAGMEKRFGGMMEAQSHTFQGAMSTIKDSLMNALATGFQPFFAQISKGADSLGQFLSGAEFQKWAADVGKALAGVVETIGGVIGFLRDNFEALKVVAAAALSWLAVGRLVAFAGAIGGIGVQIVGLIPKLVASVAALTGFAGAEDAATAGSIRLRLGLMSAQAAMGAWAIVITLIVTQSKQIAQGLRVLAYSILGFFQSVADAAASLPGPWQDAAASISKSLGEMRAGIVEEMRKTQAELDAEKEGTTAAIVDPVKAGVSEIASIDILGAGEQTGTALADGLRASRSKIDEALDQLSTDLKNSMNKQTEIAKLGGLLTGAELAKGLKSTDPVVKAQAEATRALIVERLDKLTDGAYSAGLRAGKALELGFYRGARDLGRGQIGEIVGSAKFSSDLEKSWKALDEKARLLATNIAKVGTSASGAGSALSQLAADAKTRLGAAFDAVRTKAKAFFDDLHSRNLKAISDARDLANAQLDAQAAALQAPVDAMRKALADKQAAAQEQALRERLGQAQAATYSSPAEAMAAIRDAQTALDDFLAQKAIDAAQQQVDAQVAVLTAQKKSNDELAKEQTDAENKRYKAQVAAFDKELKALQEHLAKHPKEWDKSQQKVLALLAKYGVDMSVAGANLGARFADGLKSQAAAVEAAAKALAEAAAKYLKVKSPTKAGPLAEDQSQWGANLARAWSGGLRREMDRLTIPSLGVVAGSLRVQGPAVPSASSSNTNNVQIALNVGTMIATEGEQRAFVRMVKARLEEELWRTGQPALSAVRGGR